MREDVATKGRRLLVEARLTITVVSDEQVSAVCRGDSAAIYRLGFYRGRWFCTCPAVGVCSHLRALMLVVLAPTSKQ
jgi:uncharacterized Zn finger protein